MNGNLVIFESKEGDHARDKDIVAACVVLYSRFSPRPGAHQRNVFWVFLLQRRLVHAGRSTSVDGPGRSKAGFSPRRHGGGFSQTFGSESVTILCPARLVEPKHQRPRVQHALWPARIVSVGKLRPFAKPVRVARRHE